MEEDVAVAPGTRAVRVTFVPDIPATENTAITFEGTLDFERGRVVLLTHDAGRLVTRSPQR